MKLKKLTVEDWRNAFAIGSSLALASAAILVPATVAAGFIAAMVYLGIRKLNLGRKANAK